MREVTRRHSDDVTLGNPSHSDDSALRQGRQMCFKCGEKSGKGDILVVAWTHYICYVGSAFDYCSMFEGGLFAGGVRVRQGLQLCYFTALVPANMPLLTPRVEAGQPRKLLKTLKWRTMQMSMSANLFFFTCRLLHTSFQADCQVKVVRRHLDDTAWSNHIFEVNARSFRREVHIDPKLQNKVRIPYGGTSLHFSCWIHMRLQVHLRRETRRRRTCDSVRKASLLRQCCEPDEQFFSESSSGRRQAKNAFLQVEEEDRTVQCIGSIVSSRRSKDRYFWQTPLYAIILNESMPAVAWSKWSKRNRDHTEEEIRHRRVTPEAQGSSSRVQAKFLSTTRLVPVQ